MSLAGVRYTLTYDVTHSTPGVFPFYWYFSSISGVWTTTVRVQFTNTGWQTAPSGSKVWVQVCNYIGSYDAPTNTSSVGLENSCFQIPNYSFGLLSMSPTGTYIARRAFTDVNPRAFDVSSFAVDPSDATGKTGYITWNATSSSPYPWTVLPPDPTTTVHWANGSGTSFFGVVWAYAQPSGDGWTSLSSRGITTAYSVPADE